MDGDSVYNSLKKSQARCKFLSLAPLLGPLPDIPVNKIDWVIVGGESGPGARPVDAVGIRDIRDNCLREHVPFFFKQWCGVFKKRTGRTWNQMPPINTI